MKKLFILTFLLIFAFLTIPLNAQNKKKKETRKERKERMMKWVDEQCRNKTFRIGITRLCPKDGVAQNITYGNDGYFVEFNNLVFSCNLPYSATTERTGIQAYTNQDNLYVTAKNQAVTLIGGWQEGKDYYAYQFNFWNNDVSEGNEVTPIRMTMYIYQNGECMVMAEWPNMNPMSYMGKLVEMNDSKK